MQRTNEAVIQIFQVQPGEEHADDRQTLHFLRESPKDVILLCLLAGPQWWSRPHYAMLIAHHPTIQSILRNSPKALLAEVSR